MSTGYTKGPWTNTPGQCTIWANDGDLKVARVEDLPWIENSSGRKSSDWMTEAANARLIAAAPCLLEACKEAHAAMVAEQHLQASRGESVTIEIGIAKQSLERVIAKATGGAVE